jgi:hypothetical protein
MAKKAAWQPSVSDAINLAALRWYAATNEALLIEIYATDRDRFGALLALLRVHQRELRRFASAPDGIVEEDCPPGWVRCKDGLCAPSCDPDLGQPLARRSKGRRRVKR